MQVGVTATQPWAGPSDVTRERGRVSSRRGESWESESVCCSVMSSSLQPHGSSVHGILQAFSGVCCHFLPWGIFLTQGLNPRLLHCRRILYYLSHQGSPEHWG